jgi:putative transposase
MRSKTKDTVSVRDVHAHAAALIETHLKIQEHGYKCRAAVLISILLFAAARLRSIFDACGRLRDAPSDQAVRDALVAMLPDMNTLERRINTGLSAELPRRLTKRSQRLAVDLTLIPYHGQPFLDANEIYRSQPKSGTTHFHAYASCYVVEHGQRFTLAMIWVGKGEPLKETLQRLLKQVRSLGVKIRFLLLDREFYSVNVIRYLQASRTPFLMPVAHRGRKPADPTKAKGTRRFLAWKKGGFSKHTLQNKDGRRATVRICVCCRNYAGRRKRHGRKRLVYAFWGFQPGPPAWVREEYRKRFGIETSYRQMNQCRIRTCTRNPLLRLLFVGIALLLRNVWVWFHLNVLADRHANGCLILRLELLCLTTLTLMLQHAAEHLLGRQEDPATETPDWKPLSIGQQCTI